MGAVPPDVVQRAIDYHLYGGKENLKQFFCWLGELSGKYRAGQAQLPQELSWAGIYHPRVGRFYTSLEEYLAWYGERRPLIGLLFPRVFWVEENLAGYDAIIEEIEHRGAGLLPEGMEPDPPVLHEKLTMLRESQFRDGLHIFGEAPEEEALAELLNTVLKLDQPDCPALRRALAENRGLAGRTNGRGKRRISGRRGGHYHVR